MKTETIRLEANADGLPLSLISMVPEEDPRLLVVIHHGMAEHKERYLWLMQQLCDEGYACFIADVRGHGDSVKDPSDRGYFYGVGAHGLLLDLHQVIYYAKERFPSVPLLLLGHSMGSLAAQAYGAAHNFGLDGLVLSGAPAENKAAALGRRLNGLLMKKKGPRGLSKLMDQMSLGAYEKPFRKEGKNAWLAVDKEVWDRYNASDKCGFSFTLDGYGVLLELLSRVFGEPWEVSKSDLPVLYMAGANDPVIGGAKGFRNTVHHARSQGFENVRGKLYPGIRHEIFNDLEKEKAVSDLKIWIRQNHIPKDREEQV